MVSLPEAVKLFISRGLDFEGRSSRSEYWWVQLAYVLLGLLYGVIFIMIMGTTGQLGQMERSDPPLLFWIVSIPFGLLVLFLIIPSIALQVRRFHDRNMTGWFVLIFAIAGIVPIIGYLASIANIVIFCLRGTDGPNQYGPDPLRPGHDELDRIWG